MTLLETILALDGRYVAHLDAHEFKILQDEYVKKFRTGWLTEGLSLCTPLGLVSFQVKKEPFRLQDAEIEAALGRSGP